MAKENKYSIKDLKRDFPSDRACLDLIFKTLHSEKCSCGGAYSLISNRKQYQCSKCRFQIAPTGGTIFHKSATPLSLWFHAIFIFSNAKSGISAKEMERQLGVTYKCAYRILSQIRKALKQDTKPLRGVVEVDSAYFGGVKHVKGRTHAHAIAEKDIVLAAIERGGKMKAEVGSLAGFTMVDFLRRNVMTGAKLMTDSAPTYGRKARSYKHQTVNHSKGEYARGEVHINTIEAFFSHVKRSINGTFKTISKKHLQTYLDSFVFHWNNSHNDNERFAVLLQTLLHA